MMLYLAIAFLTLSVASADKEVYTGCFDCQVGERCGGLKEGVVCWNQVEQGTDGYCTCCHNCSITAGMSCDTFTSS